MALVSLAVASGAFAETRPGEATGALTKEDQAVLVAMLRGAEDQGFGKGDFDPAGVEARLQSPDPDERARADALLRQMAQAYARAQRGGRLTAGQFRNTWAIRPEPYDATSDFGQALARHDFAAWAASLAPPDPRDARLVSAYARYRALAAAGGWPRLAMKGPIGANAPAGDLRALRDRLAVEDPAVAPSSSATLDLDPTALTAAIQRAQARYGLKPDGVAGPGTLAALNVPVERRLAQMRANLERWRWMPRTLPAERVELNIAAAWFDDYEDNVPVLSMRAIVGRPKDPTPSFQDHIHAILFYPPWNVPTKIAANELWPKERRQPGYLAREGFRRLPNGRLQQNPGPKNSLGLVKFELDDTFAVYFHDTPARSLFARDERALSHGCMRLEQPYALAKRLLRTTPDWPEARVDAALEAGVTQRAVLPKRVMAYVTYWTAFVDDQGQVNFRPDVYGWDDDLIRLLGS